MKIGASLLPPPPPAAAAALLAPRQLRVQAQASEVAAVSQDLTKSTQQFKQKLPINVHSHNEWSLLEEVGRGHSGRSLILHIGEKNVAKKGIVGTCSTPRQADRPFPESSSPMKQKRGELPHRGSGQRRCDDPHNFSKRPQSSLMKVQSHVP